MQKVLLPYDGSNPSKNAIQFLIDAFKQPADVQVYLANVAERPVLYGDYLSAAMLEQLEQDLLASSKALLKEPLESLQKAGFKAEPVSRVGTIAGTIADLQKELSCDHVVMGTRGLGKLGNVFIGSVAMKVVHEVKVPVTLVH